MTSKWRTIDHVSLSTGLIVAHLFLNNDFFSVDNSLEIMGMVSANERHFHDGSGFIGVSEGLMG